MNDILTLLGEFVAFMLEFAFWYCVWTAVFAVVQHVARRNRPTAEEHVEMIKKVASLIHEVKPEKHGDVTYWFDADTDQFLGQGKNEDEIRKHLLERFKGHVFLVDKDRALAGPLLEAIPLEKLKLSTDMHSIQ